MLTADKDPNFFNNLEARSRVVAPADRLDHIVRVAEVTASLPTSTVIDHTTGGDVREPSVFNNPANQRSLQKLDGYLPAKKPRELRVDPISGKVKPVFITKKDKRGKEIKIQVEAPYYDNPITGEREYEDFRPIGRRIASDIHGNPLTFATKPGETGVPRRSQRTALADVLDYDDDDPASLMARK
jgi:hypothetical protein